MEREYQIETTELTDEELEAVNGGLLLGLLFKANAAFTRWLLTPSTEADWNDAH